MTARIITVISVALALSQPSYAIQYRWPFDSGNGANGPHRIAGTFGEYRNSSLTWPSGRLHAGQDINPSSSASGYDAAYETVVAIEGGLVDSFAIGRYAESVKIGRFVYTHISVYPLRQGQTINKGDPIGEIKDLSTVGHSRYRSHLHLAEFESETSTVQLNPLRDGDGLSNYSDTIEAKVLEPTFHSSKQGAQIQSDSFGIPRAWGYVDVRARGFDKIIESTAGVYEVGFAVENATSGYLLNPVYRIRLARLKMSDTKSLEHSNDTKVFDPFLSHINTDAVNDPIPTRYYYWLTNRLNASDEDPVNQDGIIRDGFWNTKQRVGAAETVPARVTTEAKFPDGRITFWSLAKDIRGNGADTATKKGADDTTVIIDNFKPYIDQLSVSNATALYAANWSNIPNDTGDKLIRITGQGDVEETMPLLSSNDMIGVTPPMTIIMSFLEEMDTKLGPTLSAKFKSGGDISIDIKDSTWANTAKSLTLQIDSNPFGGSAVSGTAVLKVSGLKDIAGNDLDAYPFTIASRDTNGNWVGTYENPPDTNHILRIDALAPKMTDTRIYRTTLNINGDTGTTKNGWFTTTVVQV